MNFLACPMLRKLRVVFFSPSIMTPFFSSKATFPLPLCIVTNSGSRPLFMSVTTPLAISISLFFITSGLSFSFTVTCAFFSSPILFTFSLAFILNFLNLQGLHIFLRLFGLLLLNYLKLLGNQLLKLFPQFLLVLFCDVVQRGSNFRNVLVEGLPSYFFVILLLLVVYVARGFPSRIHQRKPYLLNYLLFLRNCLLSRGSVGHMN